MSKHTVALSELSGTWLVEQQFAEIAFKTLLEHGAPVDSVTRSPERKFGFIGVGNIAMQLGLTNVPENAGIVVIRLQGMLYEYESYWIQEEIAWASRTQNVLAVVLAMNCPGGPEHAAYRVHDALKQCKKPTTAVCDHGMMGSGGYLMATGADRIVASRVTDEIGSIGAYTTFRDFSSGWQKEGYMVKDIYAQQSTEKNSEYRAAQKGNFKPLEANMTRKAQDFIDLVKSRRPKIKATAAGDPFKGGVFTAVDALAMGLIDAIEPMDLAVQTMLTLFSDDECLLNPNDSMFGYIQLPALAALIGAAAEAITDEQVAAINAELSQKGLSGLALVSQAQFTAAADNANKITALTAERDQLKAKLSAQPDQTELNNLKTQLSTITTERDTLKTQVATLGTQPGAAPTVVPTQVDPAQPSTGAQLTAEQVIAGLPHSKALDANPFFN